MVIYTDFSLFTHLECRCHSLKLIKFSFYLLLPVSFLRCIPVPVVNANDITALNLNGKESLWIDRGWRAGDTDKDSGLSEAKLLGNSNSMQSGNYTDGGTDYAEVDTRNMSTFYNCRKVCRRRRRLATLLFSISRNGAQNGFFTIIFRAEPFSFSDNFFFSFVSRSTV